MSELPPDVRDRAAQRAQSTWLMRPSDGWRAVVDAVAEVLAADLGLMTREECDQKVDRLLARPILNELRTETERDALKVRVVELEEKIEYWHQRWVIRNEHVDLISCDRDALKARVDLLTTALQADLAVLQVLGRPDPEDPEFPAALAQERAESVRALFAASHIE